MVPYDVPLIDSDFITRALRLRLAGEGGRAEEELGIDRPRLTRVSSAVSRSIFGSQSSASVAIKHG